MAGSAEATALIRADNRRLRGDLQRSDKMFRKTFAGIGRGIKGALSGALSPLGIGLGVAGLAALGREVVTFEEGLVRLGIQAKQSDAWIGSMRQTIVDLSDDTGIAREAILGAASGIVDLEGAAGFSVEKMQSLLRVNMATGAEMEHLAGIMFALNQSFFDGKGSAAELEASLGAITAAGKEGSIPLSEMAAILRQVAPVFKQTGATGKQAAADLSALLQVGATGAFGGASEVGTGLDAFISSLSKAQDRLKEFGVEPFEVGEDGVSRLKDVRTLLLEIGKSPLMKRRDLITPAFGRGEAAKFITVLLDNFERFEELAASGMDAGELIKTDALRYANSEAAKLNRSMNRAREAMLKAFTPERIKAAAELVERVAEAIGWAADHAKQLIALWATFKAGSLAASAAQFAAMAASTEAIAAGTSSAAASIAGWVGGITAAAAAGYAFGTWLDETFGLSDKISDAAAGIDAKTGHVKDAPAYRFTEDDLAGFAANPEATRRKAGLLLNSAVDDLNEAGTGPQSLDELTNEYFQAGWRPTAATRMAHDRHGDIERAFQAREQYEERRMGVDVRITVDQRGLIKAEQVAEHNARRGGQS